MDPRLHEHAARLQPGSARRLCIGNLHPEVKKVSPHLVELHADDPLTRLWQGEGWGQNWGLWIESRTDLHAIHRRMRHFTQAKLPSGEGPVLFRFWDPRVFRVYMPLVEAADLAAWFQDIDGYVAEAEDGKGAVRYRLEGSNLARQDYPDVASWGSF